MDPTSLALLAASRRTPEITYGNAVIATGSGSAFSTYTFPDVSLGTARPDRIVVVALSGGLPLAEGTWIDCTIAGIVATKAVEHDSVTFRPHAIFYANVPNGTTGTVVGTVNVASTQIGSAMSASIVNLAGDASAKLVSASTSIDTIPVTNQGLSASITPAPGAVLFASFGHGSTDSTVDITWTNATKQAQQLFQTNVQVSSVATSSNLSGSSLTVTATTSDSSTGRPSLLLTTWL